MTSGTASASLQISSSYSDLSKWCRCHIPRRRRHRQRPVELPPVQPPVQKLQTSPAVKETRNHARSPHEVFSTCSHFVQGRSFEDFYLFMVGSDSCKTRNLLIVFWFQYLHFLIRSDLFRSHPPGETKACVHRRQTCAVIFCQATRFSVLFLFRRRFGFLADFFFFFFFLSLGTFKMAPLPHSAAQPLWTATGRVAFRPATSAEAPDETGGHGVQDPCLVTP